MNFLYNEIMKHLLIIFSLLITSISWSKNVDWNDLIKRDGLWYEKFTNEPFTGNSTGLKQGEIGFVLAMTRFELATLGL